ncbi:MAG: GNAT family N-acetyltransferase [Pseudomonadota bacterium]
MRNDTLCEGLDNPRVAANLCAVPMPYRREDALAKIAADWRAWPHEVSLGIFLRASTRARHVGGIALKNRSDRARGLELGYWVAEPYWGRGIAVEAGRAVIEHAFLTWRLDRLHAGHYVDNPRSGRVLERLGFARTGEISVYARDETRPNVRCVEFELHRSDWTRHWRHRQGPPDRAAA